MRIAHQVMTLAVAALLLVSASRALAAPEQEHKPGDSHADKAGHDAKAGDKDHKEGEHKEGSHDNNPFKWALEESIWTIAVFLLLLFVLGKFAWGPILQGLKKREDQIRLAIEEAKLARAETEKVRLEFKAEMDRAYAEIPKIMETARRDAAALREEMKSKSAAEIQADRDRLRREIETAKDQALSEIWTQSAQLATLISAKAIGRSLTDEDQRRLNEEAIAVVEGATDQARGNLRQFGEEWTRKGGGSA